VGAEVDVHDVVRALFIIDGDLLVALGLLGLSTGVHGTASTATAKCHLKLPPLPCLLLLQYQLIPMTECWIFLIDLFLKYLLKSLSLLGAEALLSKQVYLQEDLQVEEFLILSIDVFLALHKTEV